MVIAIEPFLDSLLPSGRCPRGISVLHGEPGRWVVWEGPGDHLMFVLRKPEKKSMSRSELIYHISRCCSEATLRLP